MTDFVAAMPWDAYGTQGQPGIGFSVTPDGNIQQVPYTRTAPFGEAPLLETVPADPAIPEAAQRFNPTDEEIFLHDQIHGTPWHGYVIQEWVNPENPGIPNLGPVNEQPFQSGHTSAVQLNPADEQGWGMDPAILLPRYPKVTNTNPFYASGTHRRMGDWDYDPTSIPFYDVTAQSKQLQYEARRRRSTMHGKLADIAPAVPFSSNVVPVGGNAGPLNILPMGVEGIY